MKFSLPTRFAAAALLAGAAFAASAQTPPAAPGGPGMGMGPGGSMMREHPGRMDPAKMQERMAKRFDALKQKLAITPAQEAAWTNWTNAMKPPANLQRPNREEIAKLPTPERIDRMRQLRSQRLAEADKRADATKAFYAQLTPQQQKSFDEASAKMQRHGPGGHHPRG